MQAGSFCTRQGDLGRAAEIRFGRLPELEKKLPGQERSTGGAQKNGSFLREEVTRTTSPPWCPSGPAFPWKGCWRASRPS